MRVTYRYNIDRARKFRFAATVTLPLHVPRLPLAALYLVRHAFGLRKRLLPPIPEHVGTVDIRQHVIKMASAWPGTAAEHGAPVVRGEFVLVKFATANL